MALACAQLRIATGPKTGDLEAIRGLAEIDAADHRAKTSLRFAVIGDTGTGDWQQTAVAEAMLAACEERGGCDFVLLTGDIIYDAGVPAADARGASAFVSKFEEPYSAFGRTDFWLVAGNHDWYRKGSTQAEIRYTTRSDRWRMPALDYAVPRLPDWLSIYGLETTLISQGIETGQVERARQSLCPGTGWRFLFGHHPVYTAGVRHSGGNGTLEKIRDALLEPLIEPCRVDVYFAGHDHLQAHLETPAFHQVVQGAGGRKLYKVAERYRFPDGSGVTVTAARSVFGFALAEATERSLSLAFFEVGNAPDASAAVFHETTIDRPQ